MKREDILLEDLSEVGLETMRRCNLEGERRFCGNVTEDVTGAPLIMSTREKLSTVLDLRTCRLEHVHDDALKREIVNLLRQEYIIFGKKACLFLQEQKIAKTAASAAAKTAAEDALKPIVITDTESSPVPGYWC